MVIADLNILCDVQPSKIFIPSYMEKDVFHLKKNRKETIYVDRYLDLQKKTGVWYQLYPLARNQYDYEKEFFDLCINDNGEPQILFINKLVKNDIIDVIKTVISHTENRMYIFLDLQGYEQKEQIIGSKEFCCLLEKEEMKFNTVYTIV